MNRWMKIARREYRTGEKMKKVELDAMKDKTEYDETGSGWSGDSGKKRYVELRKYAYDLVRDPEKREGMEALFAKFYRENREDTSVSKSRKRKAEKIDITKDDELADNMENDLRMLFGEGLFQAV